MKLARLTCSALTWRTLLIGILSGIMLACFYLIAEVVYDLVTAPNRQINAWGWFLLVFYLAIIHYVVGPELRQLYYRLKPPTGS
jgi:hypothetical protein